MNAPWPPPTSPIRSFRFNDPLVGMMLCSRVTKRCVIAGIAGHDSKSDSQGAVKEYYASVGALTRPWHEPTLALERRKRQRLEVIMLRSACLAPILVTAAVFAAAAGSWGRHPPAVRLEPSQLAGLWTVVSVHKN